MLDDRDRLMAVGTRSVGQLAAFWADEHLLVCVNLYLLQADSQLSSSVNMYFSRVRDLRLRRHLRVLRSSVRSALESSRAERAEARAERYAGVNPTA